ncbi:MAG TPA: protein kinase [Mycobacteriales bacterium]|nr:protein kinase [Mycobacteriales bacterium]
MADAKVNGRLVADRYLLEEQVGRGGMGVVWRAQDQLLGRAVAVKEVHLQPGLTDEERHGVQQRVMREARAAASLNHVGAVTVYDVVEDSEQAFIVMELIEAPTLADLVADRGPLPAAEVAAIGVAICDVLAVAHDRGIVHRDLKPANVLVADAGVKLTDFGIATVKDDPRLTSTGIVLGSPSYIAPEQARGHQVTAATDMWGLGATLCYSVTGRPPFDRGEAIATLTAVAHDELEMDPMTGALTPVLLQLLDKDPLARPDAAQVRAELARVAAGAASSTMLMPAVAPATVPVSLPAEATIETPRVVAPPEEDVSAPPRRRSVVPALLVGLLLLGGVGLAASQLAGDDKGNAPTGVLGESSAPSPSGGAASKTPAATAAPPSDEAPAVPAINELTEIFTNEKAGYSLRYPQGWQQVERAGNALDFREPSTGRYLRIDWTNKPGDDAVADWERQSQSFGARHADYEELRIEPKSFQGFDGAIWDYRYSDRGARLRASNFAIVTEDRGFALNFQTREIDWDRSQKLYDLFVASFEILERD